MRAIGAAWGGFSGVRWFGTKSNGGPLLFCLAALGASSLLVVGLAYIGDWTNSEGPDPEGMVGILGIPASLLIFHALAKRARARS